MIIKVAEIKKKLNSFEDWKVEQKKISKVFTFPDFKKAIGFVNKIATEAEKVKHHPDINIRYNKVKIVLSTHSEGGVTNKDLDLAKRIDNSTR